MPPKLSKPYTVCTYKGERVYPDHIKYQDLTNTADVPIGERQLIYNRRYVATHCADIAENQRIYRREHKVLVRCQSCGSILSRLYICNHKKTQKHIRSLNGEPDPNMYVTHDKPTLETLLESPIHARVTHP